MPLLADCLRVFERVAIGGVLEPVFQIFQLPLSYCLWVRT